MIASPGTAALLVAFVWMAVGTLVQSADAQDTLEHAQGLMVAHHLQEANEMLSTIVAADAGNISAWQQLGEVQLSQSLNEDAMKSFEAVLGGQPASVSAQRGETRAALAAALADRASGNANAALSLLLRAKRWVPQSEDILIAFGIQADSMQLFADADEALTGAVQAEPNNARALYALAHTELDEQKTGEAEKHLRDYLRMKPEDATAHYGLGHLLHLLANNEEAKTELDRSIELQPHQTESYYDLGQIALDQHQDDAASAAYMRVLQTAPHHGGALTGMGILFFRRKEYSDAGGYLRQAILYAPDYTTAHHYYGLTLAHLGQAEQSRQELALATQLTEQQNKQRHGYHLLTRGQDQ